MKLSKNLLRKQYSKIESMLVSRIKPNPKMIFKVITKADKKVR